MFQPVCPYQIKTSREVPIGDFSYSSQWPKHWQSSLGKKKCLLVSLVNATWNTWLEAHKLLTTPCCTPTLADATSKDVFWTWLWLCSAKPRLQPRPILALRLVFNCFANSGPEFTKSCKMPFYLFTFFSPKLQPGLFQRIWQSSPPVVGLARRSGQWDIAGK